MRLISVVVLAILFLLPVASPAADFDGDSRSDIAIFRPSSGLWAVRGVTRVYFGESGDAARPGDYNGDGIADIAIFRGSSGLWAVRNVTRVYFGQSSDTPIQGGSDGQRTYDYVVKAGDGDDLVDALESTSYRSVFIPNGTYTVSEVIDVTYVRHIVGEHKRGTIIRFTSSNYLLVEEDYCHLENIQFEHENANPSFGSLVDIDQVEWVVLEDCRFDGNENVQTGLQYDDDCNWLQLVNCYTIQCTTGYSGSTSTYGTTFSNCVSNNCDTGFFGCENLSSCVVRGGSATDKGFENCNRIAACKAFRMGTGFDGCKYITACQVDGSSYTGDTGFTGCDGISACHVFRCTIPFTGCNHQDDDSVWFSN